MVKIIPAIIAKTKEEFERLIAKVEPYTGKVQLDIMDGLFVPNTTIGFEDIEQVETALGYQVHLMVNQSEEEVGPWLESNNVEEVIFHIESTDNPLPVAKMIRASGKGVGVAINPATDFKMITSFVDEIDFVQFMTVEPGAYGGEFVVSVLDKIGDFHKLYPDKPIAVDGGVNPETAVQLSAAGASIFVAGSYIFSSADVGKAIEDLAKIIKNN